MNQERILHPSSPHHIITSSPHPSSFPVIETPDWMLDKEGRLAQFLPTLPTSEGQVHILTTPGIGDFAWVWAKLWQLALEKDVTFHFPEDGTRRIAGYADMLGIKYDFLNLDIREILRYPGEFKRDEYAAGGIYYVHANRHLEDGKRIEEWHDEYRLRNPIVPYLGGWNPTYYDSALRYITVHMCMTSYVEGNWLPRRWAMMLKDIEKNFAPVKVVGALWDTSFAKRVFDFWTPTIKPALDLPLAKCLSIISHSRAHVGLDSGLTILSKYMGVPSLQAFPRWLCDPKPVDGRPNGTHMPGTYDFDFHPKSQWCFVDELMDTYADWLGGVL